MKETDFTDMQEMVEGYDEICDQFQSADHPDKPNKNFRLQKHWYVMDKGIDASKSTEMAEKVERTTAETNGALGCLGLDDGVKRGMTLIEQHRGAFAKLQQGIAKLG